MDSLVILPARVPCACVPRVDVLNLVPEAAELHPTSTYQRIFKTYRSKPSNHRTNRQIFASGKKCFTRKAEVSKVNYSSKAQSFNVRYFRSQEYSTSHTLIRRGYSRVHHASSRSVCVCDRYYVLNLVLSIKKNTCRHV